MQSRYAATVEPLKVWLKDDGQPYLRPQRLSAAQRAGKSYERRVLAQLAARLTLSQRSLSPFLIEKPWFAYLHCSKRLAYCQPDGLLIDLYGGHITILEIKLRHTQISFWQLRNLYLPVIRKWLEGADWSYRLCEVVKYFDPVTSFPIAVQLREDVLDCSSDTFNVCIMKV